MNRSRTKQLSLTGTKTSFAYKSNFFNSTGSVSRIDSDCKPDSEFARNTVKGGGGKGFTNLPCAQSGFNPDIARG